MLSINTNLSSLIAQQSLSKSTNTLNLAIERMTTGYKINHARDNAANYSISGNMTMQLSAFDVASDNIASGMDLISTASDIISQMQNNAARLNALSTQARNGTYGTQSLDAINTEAKALISEIMRLYNTAEYNNISLFDQISFTLPSYLPQPEDMPVAKAEYNGFIEDAVYETPEYIDALPSISSVTTSFTEDEYKIETADDLAKLASLTNSGVDTSGATFFLANDIDLGAWCDAHMATGGWVPIGSYSRRFKGDFNGNGHVIKNLKINRDADYQGLFGCTRDNIVVMNIGILNANIRARNNVGALFGNAEEYGLTDIMISNCYSTGTVTGTGNDIGGLLGHADCYVEASYSTATVSGNDNVGGFFGGGQTSTEVYNCYATGDVKGNRYVGGFAGSGSCLENCYSTGDVKGNECVGGFVGISPFGNQDSCYSTGDVEGVRIVGGFVGSLTGDVASCYSTGNVQGERFVGGFVGMASTPNPDKIDSSVSYSKVSGADSSSTGTFIGGADVTTWASLNLANCESRAQKGMVSIGGAFNNSTPVSYDLTTALSNISDADIEDASTSLQVGIYGDESCQIVFDTNFQFDISKLNNGLETVEAFNAIVDFEKLLNEKATELGAVQNRLESALDLIEVNIDNLTSSRSTIRDADIADVSSEYIRQQILQQAAATLLSTANQSPALALQLL